MEKKKRKRSKDRKNEFEDAEKKLQSLYEKRDALNEEGKTHRDERDQLNQEKGKLYKRIETLKLEREKAFEMLNIHKGKRDSYQALARELIKTRRDRDGNIFPVLAKEVAMLRTSIREQEWAQQTTPMSIEKERELIDKLRTTQQELKEKEKALSKQSHIKDVIEDLNESITTIFKKADSEHVLVQRFYTDAQAYKKEMDETFEKIKDLTQMADKCHIKFLKCRERADAFHQKAQDMKQQIMGTKQEAREERRKARQLIDDQNRQVKDTLEDEEKLKEAAEESLESLLKRGKVKL